MHLLSDRGEGPEGGRDRVDLHLVEAEEILGGVLVKHVVGAMDAERERLRDSFLVHLLVNLEQFTSEFIDGGAAVCVRERACAWR